MPSVLITGASKGIGRATAQEFAKRGYRVIATARDPHALHDLDADQRLAVDVTDQASVDAAVAAAGDVDVLVSNAGSIFYAAVEASPLEEVQRLFAQNTVGALRVTQALLPQFRARGAGRLLYVSSVVAHVVLPGNSAYAASKWALSAFVEDLALETVKYGVRATLLEPGPVSSGALDDVLTYTLPDDPYAHLQLGRGSDRAGFITPEEVAQAIADAADLDDPPLRIPVGAMSQSVLARRKAAPDDVPFRAAG